MLDQTWKRCLWWLCFCISPAILIAVELFHPAGFTHDPGMFQYLSHDEPHTHEHKSLGYFGPEWWFALHMVQTPLVCFVAIGLWLLVSDVGRDDGLWPATFAWLSRAATFVFAVYYTALDAVGGFGMARSILITQELTAEGVLTKDQMDGVAIMLNRLWVDPWVGGQGSMVSETGSWAVFAAALAAAIALFLQRRTPWPPLVLLIAFGWELQVSHAMPHGPIAFSLLLAASFWLMAHHRRHRAKKAT